jgi:hypothetical protein
MFDTLPTKFEFKGIEMKDQMCEDMMNKEEFLYESTPSCLISTTPIIPQQCGKEGVEWSSLSRTQKKNLKTKAKINIMNNLLNDESIIQEGNKKTQCDNPVKDYVEKDVNSKPIMTPDDPVISKIKKLLVTVFDECKINDADIINIVAKGVGAPD